MASQVRPKSITGGCLCEGVRYTITFPPDHDFASNCSTCQCTQCRKQTGSLLMRDQSVPLSAVAFTAQATLGRYRASEGRARGFCTRCGSFLFWQDERTDRICMTVGCFDREALAGPGGALLTRATRHLWCNNEIEGVTDHLPGDRWKYDSEQGEVVLLSKK